MNQEQTAVFYSYIIVTCCLKAGIVESEYTAIARQRMLIETFTRQRESKTCFRSNESVENPLRRCSLFRRPAATSRDD
jgi:hypothetical protein